MTAPTLRCPCERKHDVPAFVYDAPPAGETRFDLRGQQYRRRYLRCTECSHWYADTAMDLGALYGGAYVDSTYAAGMRKTFDRIRALPPEKSDNAGRVRRIVDFAARYFPPMMTAPALLDVGSGLAVFPAAIKEAGWRCTALDPDPRAAAHAREVAGVDAVAADFMTIAEEKLSRYDVITFNKVLEHLEDPVAMLQKATRHLRPGGFIYVELPDEAAAAEGPGREEFFIEHYHVFSPASIGILARQSGLRVVETDRLREPSSKFTLRAFLTPTS